MKKSLIFIITIIITMSLSFCLCLPQHYSYADELTPDNYGEPGDSTDVDIDDEFVKKYGSNFSSFLFGASVLIAVVCFSFVGLKYITGGVTQKADYKKDIIPMVIGVGIIAFLIVILQLIARAAASI